MISVGWTGCKDTIKVAFCESRGLGQGWGPRLALEAGLVVVWFRDQHQALDRHEHLRTKAYLPVAQTGLATKRGLQSACAHAVPRTGVCRPRAFDMDVEFVVAEGAHCGAACPSVEGQAARVWIIPNSGHL